ncbi:unnamed protein product, partial [Polarella glacialis]
YNTTQGREGGRRCDLYSEKTLKACLLWRESVVNSELIEKLVHHFHRTLPRGDGAILVFLPGWGDITRLYVRLRQSKEPFKLITLHSLMTPEQQHEAFERPPRGVRKVVLSTNIAESSVTIDDVVYVIDSGVRKERSFDPDTGFSSLDTKMVAKANAIQRRGRAGRCREGLAVHLFPSYKFAALEAYPLPQMLSSSMEEVVLQAKVIHGGSNSEISAMLTSSMAAPRPKTVDAAVALLKSMNCLTRSGELTAIGRACAAIPVQPNVAKFLLVAEALRCIKPAACVAAFLSTKGPFQQTVGAGPSSRAFGKDHFNKAYFSDHLTMVQAYAEWRREVSRGRAGSFCDEQALSPEMLDMAYMMVGQFVDFMVGAGYDGQDVQQGDYGEVDPVRVASKEDALLRAAMMAGFRPNLCRLVRGQRAARWFLDDDREVSPFQGSSNANYQAHGRDGDEWMVYNDSMKMGRYNSIMDSSLVFSPFVLLFANAVLIDIRRGEIWFDRWHARMDPGPWINELLGLRKDFMPAMHDTLKSRNLCSFPEKLADRVADFCRQRPIWLGELESSALPIDEAVSGTALRQLSMFEWPEDLGQEPEESDQEQSI